MGTEGWEIRLDPPVGRVPDRGDVDAPGGRLLAAFRTGYDLGEWLEWYPIPERPGNVAFGVTTTRGEFVVRASRRGTEAGLRFEIQLIEHLREAGYPAPRVVLAAGGARPDVDGSFLLVTERIPGTGYDSENPRHRAEAAVALARYHEIVARFPDRLRPSDRPVLSGLERNGPHVLATVAAIGDATLDPFDRQRLSQACSYLWSQFIRVPETLTPRLPSLPQLVVHGTFGPAALHYDGDRLTGVSGYDRAAFDVRVMDLAAALDAFTVVPDRDAPDGPRLDLDRCAAFVAAYRETADLPDSELEALPLICRAQRLATVLARATEFLRGHAAHGADLDGMRAVVDLAEVEARRLKWLEAGHYDLLGALCGWRSGAGGGARRLTL